LQSADEDEDAAAEEEEALRLQQQQAAQLAGEDFGLEDDEEDEQQQQQGASGKKKQQPVEREGAKVSAGGLQVEHVAKDLSALTQGRAGETLKHKNSRMCQHWHKVMLG
jgi:hypothetical protein